jgi:hypothetical protein
MLGFADFTKFARLKLRRGKQSQGYSNLLLRQRPMIGTTRQKSKLDLPSKILAPHGHTFSLNALWRVFKI